MSPMTCNGSLCACLSLIFSYLLSVVDWSCPRRQNRFDPNVFVRMISLPVSTYQAYGGTSCCPPSCRLRSRPPSAFRVRDTETQILPVRLEVLHPSVAAMLHAILQRNIKPFPVIHLPIVLSLGI